MKEHLQPVFKIYKVYLQSVSSHFHKRLIERLSVNV